MGMVQHLQGVSIVTCTNRPQYFNNILTNFKLQAYPIKEMIIVLNKDIMALNEYRAKVSRYNNISVYKVPEKTSLGMCLNYGISKTKFPYIAKFDDDDYYSPQYLKNQIKALLRSGADIVGKLSYMTYLEESKLLVLRFPKQHNKFTSRVAGGTLLFKRQVFNHVRFSNITLGEDVTFLRNCRARGYKIFSTSPHNYIAIRRKNKLSHTWRASDSSIRTGSMIVRNH